MIEPEQLTEDLNFVWRDARRAFHFRIPNGAILSCVWTPYAHRAGYPMDSHDTGWLALLERSGGDAREHLERKSLEEVLEIIRTEADDSVEIAAFWPDNEDYPHDEDYLHPDDWNDDVAGWQSADDVQRFVEWMMLNLPDNTKSARNDP